MINNKEILSILSLEATADEPLVLPDSLKAALGLEGGGRYTAILLDGSVLLTPQELVTPAALDEMGRIFRENGVTLEDLLDGLADVRRQLLFEKYGLTDT